MTMKWVLLLVYMFPMPDSSVNACGELLTDTFGVITSPNYPKDYVNNITCEWIIDAPESSRINVEFTDFALEFHYQCAYDYVELFDGHNASSLSIGKFCGATAPPSGFESQSSSVRIVFFTDATNTARGFRLSFSRQGSSHYKNVFVCTSIKEDKCSKSKSDLH
ncbi:tolloid-like protein 1 [Dreissena polymorpha]|uniref:tolloid-like protein 1 n=1 Tax=Dreissena polymorpha TaxID=45954 RepID=UPI0022648664|nr:tolloid-like protein 1 [Dreissena polymorpha]